MGRESSWEVSNQEGTELTDTGRSAGSSANVESGLRLSAFGARRPAKRVALLIISTASGQLPALSRPARLPPSSIVAHIHCRVLSFPTLAAWRSHALSISDRLTPIFYLLYGATCVLSGILERAAERHRSASLYHQLLSS